MNQSNIKIPRAEIGVFGGSGFYDLIENAKEFEIETPFGKPSDKISVGAINKRRIAFIPRHGNGHKLPPHKIPYKANMWAMKKMGVKRIISPVAVGSLNPFIKPGDFVICDQFVNWTKNRDDTFYNGQVTDLSLQNQGQRANIIKKSDYVAHFSMADPYCNELRIIAVKICKKSEINFHETGTVVVIEGPRFSTRAESRFFSSQNLDIINMTAYPEVALARELGMCYLNIGLITDYDAGL
ncbi:MTAP family purine nucleoside phosphorylase, partial [Patescibacteria group bacterium]|nr:MTAP family purine nucleoside phosphorylase [Patescibacteria group bacterium]